MENEISLSRDKINIIVAYSANDRFISYNNDLPWKRSLRGDNKFLKTIIHPNDGTKILLIMGRITFENMPLIKDVQIAVITSHEESIVDALPFKSFESALHFGKSNNFTIIIFGGENIYREALEHSHQIFCTIVQGEFQGDRRFPECDTELTDVSHEVAKYLLVKGATKTWEFEDNSFLEGGFKYKFYFGEK